MLLPSGLERMSSTPEGLHGTLSIGCHYYTSSYSDLQKVLGQMDHDNWHQSIAELEQMIAL